MTTGDDRPPAADRLRELNGRRTFRRRGTVASIRDLRLGRFPSIIRVAAAGSLPVRPLSHGQLPPRMVAWSMLCLRWVPEHGVASIVQKSHRRCELFHR